MKPENIKYIWFPRLARGKHTMLAGRSGKGKSQLAYKIASYITKGTRFRDDQNAPKGTVVILSAEEGAKDVIVPRCLAAYCNTDKVKIVEAVHDDEGEHKFNLEADIGALIASRRLRTKNRQEVPMVKSQEVFIDFFDHYLELGSLAAAASATGVNTASVTASLRRPWHRHAGGEFQAPSRARFCSGR